MTTKSIAVCVLLTVSGSSLKAQRFSRTDFRAAGAAITTLRKQNARSAPCAAATDAYVATQAELDAISDLNKVAQLLKGQTGLTDDLVNHSQISKIVQKIFSFAPIAAVAFSAQGAALNAKGSNGTPNILSGVGGAALLQAINSIGLDGVVQEAAFINNAGAKLASLHDSTSMLATTTNNLVNNPPATCGDHDKVWTRLNGLITYLQDRQKEVLAMVPQSFLDSKDGADLTTLQNFANAP